MPQIDFNRYYKYDELTQLLKAYEQEFPNLVEVGAIGRSHEGRDIWIATLTNKESGKHEDKPAFWCDGNIHASELSASTAVLHLLNKLLTKYGNDENITRLLDTRTLYLVPRLNPDGAEWAMETPPRIIRSSTRPYPFDEEDHYGLERQDVDGDGRILNIRIKDPNGPWKISEKEPRLMVRREPGEAGGEYYRILTEGLFHNFDKLTMRSRRTKEGLDLNRNFPSGWRPEPEQFGAGTFPASEPEVHAAVTAITNRTNICGSVTFHTFSGANLRPPHRCSDDDIPPEDLWVFKEIGEQGKEMTGYPAVSVYHDFRYHPKKLMSGGFDDWMYEERGVFCWTTEIWSPQRQAGIEKYDFIDWYRDHPFEDDLKLLKWSDEKLEGKGYIDWYEFDHPQLGKVELGGWDPLYAFRNPPPDFLEAEVAPLGDWVIWQALGTPKLEVRDVVTEKTGDDLWRIRIAVQNTGWLPTNVTKQAAEKSVCRGIVGEIHKQGVETGGLGSSEPDWLVAGKLRSEQGQLAGWSHVTSGRFGWNMDDTVDVGVFEWVVKGPGSYEIKIKHERAGSLTHQVQL